MNLESKNINGNIYFKNFCVIKESEKFYGVYESLDNFKIDPIITSGKSLGNACKKAKLLQIGYEMCNDFHKSNDLY